MCKLAETSRITKKKNCQVNFSIFGLNDLYFILVWSRMNWKGTEPVMKITRTLRSSGATGHEREAFGGGSGWMGLTLFVYQKAYWYIRWSSEVHVIRFYHVAFRPSHV